MQLQPHSSQHPEPPRGANHTHSVNILTYVPPSLIFRLRARPGAAFGGATLHTSSCRGQHYPFTSQRSLTTGSPRDSCGGTPPREVALAGMCGNALDVCAGCWRRTRPCGVAARDDACVAVKSTEVVAAR